MVIKFTGTLVRLYQMIQPEPLWLTRIYYQLLYMHVLYAAVSFSIHYNVLWRNYIKFFTDSSCLYLIFVAMNILLQVHGRTRSTVILIRLR